MFVYVGVDEDNYAVKVGITNTTPEERLKNHNGAQDMFYFKYFYAKEFTKETAKECEKQVLKILRKKYDQVEQAISGKTETFAGEDIFEEVRDFAVKYVSEFTEERAKEYEWMKHNYNKYVFNCVDKFEEMIAYLCSLNDVPFDERVSIQTLRDIYHSGFATSYVYKCKQWPNLLYQDEARKYLLTNTEHIPYSYTCAGEEHF